MGSLFEQFRPQLMKQALHICGNSPAAQDAVQDTFTGDTFYGEPFDAFGLDFFDIQLLWSNLV